MLFGIVGVACFVGLGNVLLFALVRMKVGYDFVVALTQTSILNPELVPPQVATMYGAFNYVLYAMLANPVWVVFLLITTTAMGLSLFIPLHLMLSRLLFAMSFDRLLPSAFASVSDRWHTPVKGIVTTVIIAEIFLLVTIYAPQLLAGITGCYVGDVHIDASHLLSGVFDLAFKEIPPE